MCGIAGYLNVFNENVKQNKIDKMLDQQIHRGPDDWGTMCKNNLHMGMRRLSIIDLNNGKQPIYNEDMSIATVFNGEIFNFKNLRKQLESQGHIFKTNTDTEVLVHLYEEHGEDFINKINGMFSFAIWDSNKRKTIIVRDRYGVKPLYYSIVGDEFIFSSEMKSMLYGYGINNDINYESISYLFSYNYIPYPNTIFKNIKSLDPGCYIKIQDGEVSIKRYYKTNLFYNEGISYKQAFDNLDELINDSVNLRMESDVPLGAFLSGGVDSSLITSYMSKNSKEQISTFSIGFNGTKYDESKYSNIVSKSLNTKHSLKNVEYNDLSDIDTVIRYTENPHGDVSFLPTLYLSELAAQKVKVVLTGDGADELFFGYDKYTDYFTGGEKFDSYKYYNFVSVFSDGEKGNLFTHEFKNKVSELSSTYELMENHFEKNKHLLPFDRMLAFDFDYLLEGNNLIKPDRMGMKNSIEARTPFLDYRIVDFTNQLPNDFKYKDGNKKHILKELAVKYVPREVIYRNKQMFTVPIGDWFKTNLKNELYEVLFDESPINEIFNMDYIKTLYEEHISNKVNHTRKLRLLYIFKKWYKLFIGDENE
jgi:asparagine synthase (glutamine-hydrolysing)